MLIIHCKSLPLTTRYLSPPFDIEHFPSTTQDSHIFDMPPPQLLPQYPDDVVAIISHYLSLGLSDVDAMSEIIALLTKDNFEAKKEDLSAFVDYFKAAGHIGSKPTFRADAILIAYYDSVEYIRIYHDDVKAVLEKASPNDASLLISFSILTAVVSIRASPLTIR